MAFCPPGQAIGSSHWDPMGPEGQLRETWEGPRAAPASAQRTSAPPPAARGRARPLWGSAPLARLALFQGAALARVPGCPLSQHPFLLPTLILKLPRGDDAFGFLLSYWFTCLVKLQG